jgi:hypothetical protein
MNSYSLPATNDRVHVGRAICFADIDRAPPIISGKIPSTSSKPIPMAQVKRVYLAIMIEPGDGRALDGTGQNHLP